MPAHFSPVEFLELPRGAQVLSVAPSQVFRYSVFDLWFQAPAGETETEQWPVELVKTGDAVPAHSFFLGTVSLPGLNTERHVFLTGPKQIQPT